MFLMALLIIGQVYKQLMISYMIIMGNLTSYSFSCLILQFYLALLKRKIKNVHSSLIIHFRILFLTHHYAVQMV